MVVDCLEYFAKEDGDPKLPSDWKALGWLSMPQMHGKGQSESRGKETGENQSGVEGNVSLAEQCFVAENTVDKR